MGKPLVGTCVQMCPDKEMKWREKNKLLHRFEILAGTESEPKADPNRIVKQFSRSAAGKSEQSKEELRPSNILLMTMNYLMNDIIMSSVPFVEIYDFIDNRVQAIRQDITIQMIEDMNTVQIYEKCVKFYVASSYILCEEPREKFDQHLNSKQLTVCLEKILELYEKFQSENLNEIISVHLSLNMTHYQNFYRSGDFYKKSLDNSLLKLTVKICIFWIEGNFIKFFLAVQKLPVILQMCFFHQFGSIRKRALKTLSVAFNSATCRFPLETLSHWLCLTDQDTLQLCEMYKIKLEKRKIIFSKKDFDSNVMVPKWQKESLIESNLKNIALEMIINGKKHAIKD